MRVSKHAVSPLANCSLRKHLVVSRSKPCVHLLSKFTQLSSMNTSDFMDKQIMDLSKSQSNSDFIDLANPQEEDDAKKEEIMPSYDFQPIRPIGSPPQQSNLDSGGGARVWNSADSKVNSAGIGVRNYSSVASVEPSKVVPKDHSASNVALVSEIEQTLKKHAASLMHALEGVSARISQLESRTRNIENSVDDLKIAFGNTQGSTEGKLRQLENILREVQTGVQVIRDKQDILEGQLYLEKLQVSRVEHQPEPQSNIQSDSFQQIASAPLQSRHQQPAPSVITDPASLTPSNASPSASQQNLPPPVHLQNQFPPNQIQPPPRSDPYFPRPSQPQEATNQQYQTPPFPPHQTSLPAPPMPPPQYQPPSPPQYSQPPTPQHHPSISPINPSQPQFPVVRHSEEAPYPPPQNCLPSLNQPPHPPNAGNHPSQFYGSSANMYEPPSSRPASGYSPSYGSNESPPYPYGGGPTSQYGGAGMKQQPSLSSQGGGSGYSNLPTARVLPHALPTASGVGGGSGGSSTSANRVPIDDVVDKVTNMGFSRDQVRATVRKLTENGQSVDLNIVLDKLMNDGVEGQPPRGWFGR